MMVAGFMMSLLEARGSGLKRSISFSGAEAATTGIYGFCMVSREALS